MMLLGQAMAYRDNIMCILFSELWPRTFWILNPDMCGPKSLSLLHLKFTFN